MFFVTFCKACSKIFSTDHRDHKKIKIYVYVQKFKNPFPISSTFSYALPTMDYNKILEASHIAANAQNFNKSKLSEAENFLELFKKSSKPYELCFKLLQDTSLANSSSPAETATIMLCQFIAATTHSAEFGFKNGNLHKKLTVNAS